MTNAGDTFSGPAVKISKEPMKLWARVLRDPNPIHLDPAAVRAKGLGDRVINQGPANAAYVLTALLAAFPDARIEAFKVQFVDNVFDGEMALPSGVVQRVETSADGVRCFCDVALHADGRLVLSGAATLLTA